MVDDKSWSDFEKLVKVAKENKDALRVKRQIEQDIRRQVILNLQQIRALIKPQNIGEVDFLMQQAKQRYEETSFNQHKLRTF